MNPDKQRQRIAEACGWKLVDFGTTGRNPERSFAHYSTHGNEPIPDYLNDLNAMHEAEKTLCDGSGKHEAHAIELARILSCNDEGESNPYDWWKLATATAAQRAEAFLRTIGKWEDDSFPTIPATGNPITQQEMEDKE